MDWLLYIAIALSVAVFIVTRFVWSRNTYASILSSYLAEHGCQLGRVDIPKSSQTNPFPKVSVRWGAIHSKVMGVDMTHVEYRIATFTDKNGNECTRWARLLVHLFGTQDIIWEPGTTEVPDKKGWSKSKSN